MEISLSVRIVMGYEEATGSEHYTHKALWGGWYPQRYFNDIPGSFPDASSPIGASEANNVVWYNDCLRKIFGYAKVNSSALSAGANVTSLFYSPGLDDLIGTCGTSIFSNMDAASPSDITGTVTIGSSNPIDWTEWNFGGTKYVVGLDGVNVPFKYTGTGNAAILGGTPPIGKYGIMFQSAFWQGNVTTDNASVYFSALGDAESWTTGTDYYRFDSAITGMAKLGELIVVFMSDHIGIMSGTNNRLMTKVDNFISGVGCSGHFTIRNGRLGGSSGQEVLIFHSDDGIYIFDGTRKVTNISYPIFNKYASGSTSDRFNSSRFNVAWAEYWDRYDWYVIGLSDGADSTNTFCMVLDFRHPYTDASGNMVIPHWPMDNVAAMSCLAVGKSVTKLGELYFGSSDGYVRKFDPSIFTRDAVSYTPEWKSKIFDLGKNVIVQEANVVTDVLGGSTELTLYIKSGLREGDGNSGVSTLEDSADLLDSTFIMDESTLGGHDYLFKNIGTYNYGRFIQYKLESGAGSQMNIYQTDFVLQDAGGLEPNAGN